MSYGSKNSVSQFLYKAGCPATMCLIIANVISFFSHAFLGAGDPFLLLVYSTANWIHRPWTPFTWFLVGAGHPIAVIFSGMILFMFGGSLERSWGTKTFLGFYLFSSVLIAISCWVGMLVTGIPLEFAGLYFSIVAPLIAWCMLNPGETIRIYGIFPLRATYLAWLTVLFVWYGAGPPINGLFALSSSVFAYWFVNKGRSLIAVVNSPNRRIAVTGRAGTPKLSLEHFDQEHEKILTPNPISSPFRWIRARSERKKLEALWNRSFKSPPDEKKSSRD